RDVAGRRRTRVHRPAGLDRAHVHDLVLRGDLTECGEHATGRIDRDHLADDSSQRKGISTRTGADVEPCLPRPGEPTQHLEAGRRAWRRAGIGLGAWSESYWGAMSSGALEALDASTSRRITSGRTRGWSPGRITAAVTSSFCSSSLSPIRTELDRPSWGVGFT